METISFVVPLPPVALRRNRETQQKGYKAKLVREYQEQVWCAAHEKHTGPPGHYCQLCHVRPKKIEPWDRAHLTLVWRHHRVGPDIDNALASCKPLIDVLKATGPRPLGIFRDDSPDCLTVEMKVEKVRDKQSEGVQVTIERL